MFAKESLEQLRNRIDLIEVLSSHVELKRTGSAYKGLCPFHQEKTPSFVVQKGDSHYHCFGCGAHGDAIQFLMQFLSCSFTEAVENLAERFQISLQFEDKQEEKGSNKTFLKEACLLAAQFFHLCLLHTDEGRLALNYLYKRGITIDFIRRFNLGYAPMDGSLLRRTLKEEGISEETLIEVGLMTQEGRPFFRERITFPIITPTGHVIGFSARKIKEESYGGKYINTPETALFKKSRILFGLNHCRRRIAKERRAIIVEGQIDCLKLIEAGLNLTVAALGTAFGENHAEELKKLQLREAYLLFDGDEAGATAASKTGDLLQKKGIDVYVVNLPQGSDPDSFLTKYGTQKLLEELEKAQGYLSFQAAFVGKELNLNSPAGKAELVKSLKKQIEQWEEPVMVHEALRHVATLVRVPEEMVGIIGEPRIKNKIQVTQTVNTIDPGRVLELDLLRWLILMGEPFIRTARTYLNESHFSYSACHQLFSKMMEPGKHDLLSLAASVEEPNLLDEILQRRVNKERARPLFLDTLQKLLDRKWMQKREEIRQEMEGKSHSDDELLLLAKQFDAIKSARTIAQIIEG